ncbi:CRISPR-associated helicase Cas3' [Pectinatus haikarae]|uniref:CRISPR-associated helicase Cas3' n=1 Tax=Pectinatus haikarae TaxID=349096 RepID=UPI0018C46D51|nr:CRISPR-associated helicase Cas3' [Pectinatus haikarae]
MESIAHIRNENNEMQSVREHSWNTADFAEHFAANLGLSMTGRLMGILHDMGKLCESFRAYIIVSHENTTSLKSGQKIDHSTAAAKYIYAKYHNGSDEESLASEWLSMALLSHHTGLENFIGQNGSSHFLDRVLNKDLPYYDEVLSNFFEEIISEEKFKALFQNAAHEIAALNNKITGFADEETDEARQGEVYYFYTGMAIKMIFSMLIDADRLDTANFMAEKHFERSWDLENIWKEFAARLQVHLDAIPRETDLKKQQIVKARQKISDDCIAFAVHEPGIYKLSVPTGSGKTLASMRFALEHAHKWHKKRILVVIPYTSIIDQNAREIRNIFAMDDAILEHHSNVIENVDLDKSREDKIVMNEDDGYSDQAELRRSMTERWDVPVIFTTQVQLLNTLFAGGTKSIRRLHALEDSIIIFDEIQTLPVKCSFLFNEALNFLNRFCNTTVVLCTATQPELGNIEIPIHYSKPPEMVDNLDSIFAAFKRVRLENICVPGGHEIGEIAAMIWQDTLERGTVLCIANTTSMARLLYEHLQKHAEESEETILLVHLSTKMCPAHRKLLLDKLRKALNSPDHFKVICVSTQLIEAGVDISFSTVYRALAGFSSIAQAAGRCNRHGESSYGVVKIFNIQGEQLLYLEDIRKGAQAAMDLLQRIKAEDILSPEIMKQYFAAYYHSREEQLRYRLKSGQNLYDALSFNNAGKNNCLEEKYRTEYLCNMQAFRDAGRAFQVIDTQTIGVLVPYGEKGHKLAVSMNSQFYDKAEFYNKLKEAQQYMVNLFSYELRHLADCGAIGQTEYGVLILRDEFYDEGIGVKLEMQKNDFISI